MNMSTFEDPPTELTIDEAAELLNVSRAHLLDQIASGAIPSHRIGTQLSLTLADVLAYRELIDAHAGQALDAMSIEAEDAGLYE